MMHKHKFIWAGHRGDLKHNGVLIYRCRECREEKVLPMTKEDWDRIGFDQEDVHKVWHDFCKKFKNDAGWEYQEAELQSAVETWAKDYPDDVRIAGCDDTYFMSSDLVLIEHQSKNKYMGTTVVYIPQRGEPAEFFLYPGHRDWLDKALVGIWRKSQKVMTRENRAMRAKFRYFANKMRTEVKEV